jgi:hypothetical protein
MWIASTSGFFSIVQHRDFPDQFLVRARVKKDLENLFEPERIIQTPEADYHWRVMITKEEASEIFLRQFQEINYPNFKSAIAQTPDQRDKLQAYHDIWGVMWNYSKNQ